MNVGVRHCSNVDADGCFVAAAADVVVVVWLVLCCIAASMNDDEDDVLDIDALFVDAEPQID